MAEIVASGGYWALDSDGLLEIFDTNDGWESSYSSPWSKYKNAILSIVFRGTTRRIPERAFYEYRNLISVTFPDSLIMIGSTAFGRCIGLINVSFPDSLKLIDDSAFYGCTSLTSVTFPDGLTHIGSAAFRECAALVSVTIPNSVTTIEYQAFSDCLNLTTVILSEGLTTISDSVFYGCSSLRSVTIPNGVTTIGQWAFLGCLNLSHIPIPNSVTTINNGAFRDGGLTSITIPNSVTVIGGTAFYNCASLRSVVLPEGLATIELGIFYYDSSLETVSIPVSVTKIDSAFYGCDNLSEIKYKGTDDEWDNIEIKYPDSSNRPLILARAKTVERRAREVTTARAYHSITIGQYNTWTDWRLIPTSRPVVNPPEVKTNFVDVPGADGVLDFTEALDSKIHYKVSEGSWEFLICHEQIDIDTDNKYHSENRWSILWHDILNAIHGKRNQVILMDEWPERDNGNRRFYIGRVWLNSFVSDPSHSKIVFDYSLEPFRYLTEEDAQNRVNGVL